MASEIHSILPVLHLASFPPDMRDISNANDVSRLLISDSVTWRGFLSDGYSSLSSRPQRFGFITLISLIIYLFSYRLGRSRWRSQLTIRHMINRLDFGDTHNKSIRKTVKMAINYIIVNACWKKKNICSAWSNLPSYFSTCTIQLMAFIN